MTKNSNQHQTPKIGITIGDINGIGPEVIIKALSDSRILQHMTPVVFGSTKTLSYYRKVLHADHFNYSQVKEEGNFLTKKVNVVNCWQEMVDIQSGSSTKEAGTAAFKAISKSVEYLKAGHIDAVVTAPINKHNIQNDEFNFVGHTEYYTSNFDVKDSLMFLIAEGIRVGVVTGHVPLKEVSKQITKERVSQKLSIMLSSLQKDFGIGKPRIAVLGLNPHAGEEGLLGAEEQEIITPVINKFKDDGHLVFGPFPSDGFFGKGDYSKFDSILAMYHDQGLIPFKTIAFSNGVNYTGGLPIIRTSPDHGTAYGIAGKNEADPQSMRQALYQAYDIYRHRREHN